ncbi:MAG TPA: tetratricopeptide repeat protein [Bacteroidetes bacterium]|nr:tetratricopeptide repeat protein [Bacteroidota bacterium]
MRMKPGQILVLILLGLFCGALRAENQLPAGPDSLALARCENLFARIKGLLRFPSEHEAIISKADSLIVLARQAGSVKYLGRALYAKGASEAAGENREVGLNTLQTATRFLEVSKDSFYLSKVYYSTAAVEFLMEELEQAQRDVERSIMVARLVKDSLGLTLSLNVMALIQKELGNYEIAIDYLKGGLDDVGGRLRYYLLQNLGLVYKKMEKYGAAKSCFSEVAAYYEENGLNAELRIALNNLATVELRMENPGKAIEHLRKAEAMGDLNKPTRLEGLLQINLGVARQRLGRYREAVNNFVEARSILGRLKERSNLGKAMENEAECRFLLGEYQVAYELLDSAKIIGDSLQDLSRVETIAELEQKYRQETQKQRIADLKKENTMILDRNEAIATSARNQRITLILLVVILATLALLGFVLFRLQRTRYQRRTEADKQLLLRQQIKPHFIFNAMNSIQHFLVHDQKKEGLLYLGKFGTLLRLILNNSENDLVPVSEELRLIRHYLEMEQIRINHKFDYKIEIEEGIEVDDLYMPGMVLQVLAENAIWHGIAPGEGQGLIRVSVRNREGNVEVSVQDNGIGLVKSRAKKSGSRRSFGLELVRKRIKRVNWDKVTFLFRLEEEKEANGEVKGTLARIIFKGK